MSWVTVSAAEAAPLARHRARLAEKNVAPSLLAELGTYDRTPVVDLAALLHDEAQRMMRVCETREALAAYLSRWVELVIATPSRRQRKVSRYPLPADEEAVAAYASVAARTASDHAWNEHEAMLKWEEAIAADEWWTHAP